MNTMSGQTTNFSIVAFIGKQDNNQLKAWKDLYTVYIAWQVQTKQIKGLYAVYAAWQVQMKQIKGSVYSVYSLASVDKVYTWETRLIYNEGGSPLLDQCSYKLQSLSNYNQLT